MNLKNYTSSVPVERSIMMIEKLLIDAGATNISKSVNDSKEVDGIVFMIAVNQKPLLFKLPSKVDQCYKIMMKDVSPRSLHKKEVLNNKKAQAARTAWKLLFDWVSIQVSMIQIEQVELLEVFLPYAYDMKNDKTFFEKIKAEGFKLLGESSK